MMNTNYLRSLLIVGIFCLTVSCEEDITIEGSALPQNVNEDLLAVFNFENGNKLELIQSEIEGDVIIHAVQSGSIEHKEFIDFDNLSLLDVYLGLTTDQAPVPKVLADLDENKTYHQRLVTTSKNPLFFHVRNLKGSLGANQGGYKEGFNIIHAFNKRITSKGGAYKKVKSFTEVPQMDGNKHNYVRVHHKYRSGGTVKPYGTYTDVFPGFWYFKTSYSRSNREWLVDWYGWSIFDDEDLESVFWGGYAHFYN